MENGAFAVIFVNLYQTGGHDIYEKGVKRIH